MIWFFVGDVIDWLQSRSNVSGVQRVTLELLFAISELAETDSTLRFGVCSFDATRRPVTGLARETRRPSATCPRSPQMPRV